MENCTRAMESLEYLTKTKKMLKKSQKSVDYAEREGYNLAVFERGTKINKCPRNRNDIKRKRYIKNRRKKKC